MGESKCEHKYVHLETVKEKPQGISGTYSYTDWKRVDRFFCEKCLEVVERTKTASGRGEQPDWF